MTSKNDFLAPLPKDASKSKLEFDIKLPDQNHHDKNCEIKVYFKRWIILLLFNLVSIASSMQFMQYTIIENIIARYYNVSRVAVQWTSLIYNVTYIVGIFPTMHLMNKYGPRNSSLFMAVFACLGSWIKYFAVSPDRFLWVIFGQFIIASTVMPIYSLPATVASYWFSEKEVSIAVAVGYFGLSIGYSITLFITPIFIKDHEDLRDVERDMSKYLLGISILCTVVLLVTLALFQDHPKLPPSRARYFQMQIPHDESVNFLKSLKRILTNKSYLMLWNEFGIGLGYIGTTATMLNPLILPHFENGEEVAGTSGAIRSIVGILGSVIFGLILDRTKKYKEVVCSLYIVMVASEILLALSIYMEVLWMVYLSTIIMGLFGIAYLTVIHDTCVEFTYPESEALTSSLLNMANNIYGVVLTTVATTLLVNYSDFATHLFFITVLAVGLFLTFLTRFEYRRQAVSMKNYIKSRGTENK